jgi:hypothetical protein
MDDDVQQKLANILEPRMVAAFHVPETADAAPAALTRT